MKAKFVAAVLATVVIIAGCKNVQQDPVSGNAKRYPLKGKVISVDPDAKKATIDHEEVPGYMQKMTMDFPIRADWALREMKPGDQVTAELVVDEQAKDPYWLENIGIVSAGDPNNPPLDVNKNFAQVGEPVPDFALTDQDNKPLSLKGLRGKAVAITFIYARCPLPDYCIRMSTNFSDAAREINEDAELSKKVVLLTVSFDPENDTPAKLRSYGLGYMGKGATSLGVWKLAVGKDAEVRRIADFFGLRYEVDQTDKTQFNHSLRTAVIGPDGKVIKILPGKEWSPKQLIEELRAASR